MPEILTEVINSLNQIEVHGETNLVLLWNSINTLKQLRESSTKLDESLKEIKMESSEPTDVPDNTNN